MGLDSEGQAIRQKMNRFVLSNLEDFDISTTMDKLEFKLEDKWILSKLNTPLYKL